MSEDVIPEQGAPPFLGSVLRWIATTAGLSGALATAGYIVHFSQEDLLGISLDTRSSAAAFVLDGARFLTDLGVFLLSSAPSLAIAISVLLIFLGLIAAIRKTALGKKTANWFTKRDFTWTYSLLLLLAVASELAWYDLPTLYIQNALFRPVQVGSDIGLSQNLPTLLKDRTVSFRNAVICSRAELPDCTGSTIANKLILERWFSWNLFLTVFLLIFGMRTLTTRHKDSGRRISIFNPLGLLLSLALLLDLFGIPFVYAKTIKPTRFMDTEILFKKSEGAKPVDGSLVKPIEPAANGLHRKNGGPPAQPSEDRANDPEKESLTTALSLTHWYILSEDLDRITLYNQDRTQIWSIPKADLQVIEIVGEGDVLEFHFREWYNNYHEEIGNGNKT